MKIIVLLLCLQDVGSLIEKLGSNDPETRADATDALEKAGPKALPELREALKAAADKEVTVRLRSIIDTIERTELRKKIEIEIVLPDKPTRRRVKSSRFSYTIRITNNSDKDVVFWPFAGLKVLDADGKPVPRNSNLGRWGSRSRECFLEEIPFWTIPAKKTKELKDSLKWFSHDFHSITGWTIETAGDYTLEFSFRFERKKFKAMCRKKCGHHDNAGRAWNRAMEFDRTVKKKLVVTE